MLWKLAPGSVSKQEVDEVLFFTVMIMYFLFVVWCVHTGVTHMLMIVLVAS